MSGDSGKGKYLELMTWKEAEAALQQAAVVLIPLGARTKEHGLHLPLNNDWIMAEYLTRRVLDRVPAIALPTIQYGYYPAFAEYPGSVSIGKETCRDLIADVCRSMSRFGNARFYILNTGISTLWALEPARQLLSKENIVMEYTDPGRATAEIVKKISQQAAGTHADEIETSMMLYMAPEIVRMNLAQKDISPDQGPGGLTRDPERKKGVYSATGAWGDPRLATREKGEAVTEALIEHIVSFLHDFQTRDFAPAPVRSKYME